MLFRDYKFKGQENGVSTIFTFFPQKKYIVGTKAGTCFDAAVGFKTLPLTKAAHVTNKQSFTKDIPNKLAIEKKKKAEDRTRHDSIAYCTMRTPTTYFVRIT